MCGRFTQMLSWSEVHYLSGLIGGMSEEDYRQALARGDVRPIPITEYANILHLDDIGRRTLTPMRWGWPKIADRANAGRDLNMHARGETIDSRPTFAQSFRERRGIAWCDTFNEGENVPRNARQLICWRPGREPMPIAVIYQEFVDGDGVLHWRFCMVTVQENAALAARNVERMPAILDGDEAIALWLGETPAPLEDVKAVLKPYAGELIIEIQERRRPSPPPRNRDQPRLF